MTKAPTVLAFDTSAAHCAAAVICGDRVLADAHEAMTRGQAERLMPLLDALMGEAGKTWSDLSALGVGIGPGNFTGIRIAVAAARGLSLSLGIPAVGVSGLDALALDSGFALAVSEAPRGTVYSAVPGGAPVQSLAGEIVPPPGAAQIPVIGFRAEEVAALTGGIATAARYPLTEAIARIAMRRMHEADLQPAAPLYIRPADAAPAKDAPPVLLD